MECGNHQFDFTTVVQALYALHHPKNHHKIDCAIGSYVQRDYTLAMHWRGAGETIRIPTHPIYREQMLDCVRTVTLGPLSGPLTRNLIVKRLLGIVRDHGAVERLRHWIVFHFDVKTWNELIKTETFSDLNPDMLERVVEYVAVFLRSIGYRSEFA